MDQKHGHYLIEVLCKPQGEEHHPTIQAINFFYKRRSKWLFDAIPSQDCKGCIWTDTREKKSHIDPRRAIGLIESTDNATRLSSL